MKTLVPSPPSVVHGCGHGSVGWKEEVAQLDFRQCEADACPTTMDEDGHEMCLEPHGPVYVAFSCSISARRFSCTSSWMSAMYIKNRQEQVA